MRHLCVALHTCISSCSDQKVTDDRDVEALDGDGWMGEAAGILAVLRMAVVLVVVVAQIALPSFSPLWLWPKLDTSLPTAGTLGECSVRW